MPLTFEWDRDKADRNSVKHGISFEEAATVFSDVLSLTIDDPSHSYQEERYIDWYISSRKDISCCSYESWR
jgi:uncharacterized DUF497 family protein